jgi:predicted Zn-dependent protease
VAFLAMGSAQALWTSQKEVERESRLQWLTMKRSMPRPADPRVQAFVECVSNSIIAVLEEPYASMDWEIIVFDNEATNAFAMPGGKIGVYTGIFKAADTPDAFATVIGHEIAHLTENHVMERARKGAWTDWAKLIGTSATGWGQSVSDAVDIAVGLPYDRGQESEADRVGLGYMARAGYDPRSSLYLWRNMSQLGQGAPAEFLSTHPSDDRRMADLVRSMTPALIAYNEALESGRRPGCAP